MATWRQLIEVKLHSNAEDWEDVEAVSVCSISVEACNP